MRQKLHWTAIFICFLLRFLFMGVALWQLWVAVQYGCSYNWYTTCLYGVRGLVIYLCGWFVSSEWSRISKSYLAAYHAGENWWDE